MILIKIPDFVLRVVVSQAETPQRLRTNTDFLLMFKVNLSRSISMVIYGKFFEKGFISESKFSNESTPTGQKILPKVPL